MKQTTIAQRRFIRPLGFFLLSCILLLLIACDSDPAVDATPAPDVTPTVAKVVFYEYQNPSAFDIIYPQDWITEQPTLGILVFGEKDTVYGEVPGSLVTVLRVPNQEVHGTLEGEFEHYLDFGPRRDGYELNGNEYDMIKLAGRDAMAVRMSFSGDGENIPMEAHIVAAEADSGAVYFFTATSPVADWTDTALRFQLMLDSVAINE